VIAVVAAGVAVAVVLIPRGGTHDDQTAAVAAPAADAATPQAAQPKEVRARKVSPADRRLIISTLSLFISSAVARHHPERSFAVVHPALREGMTRTQWRTGNIPVVPYPAAGVDLITFETYTGRRALVEVLLEPAAGSKLVRKTFQAELRLEPAHRWEISSWVPEGVSESQYAENASTESADVVAAAAHPQHLSAKWIFVPLGALLAGLLLTPAVVFIAQAVANRRAELEDAARRRASS
jgi:hypothetical protein